MIYVLDSDHITDLIHGAEPILSRVRRSTRHSASRRRLRSVNRLGGWCNLIRSVRCKDHVATYAKLTRAVRALASIGILEYTAECDRRFEQLVADHKRVGRADLRIAATVLVNGARS